MVTAFVIAKCTPMPLTLRHSELDSESQINITQIDAESTFVASACECGVAVRHDRFRKVLDIKPTPDWKGPRSGLPQAMEPKGGTLESG